MPDNPDYLADAQKVVQYVEQLKAEAGEQRAMLNIITEGSETV